MTEAISYLIERHRALSRQFDEITKPGEFRPGIVTALQREMRGLEASILEMIKRNGD